jgi:ADP-ribose pyrophosphatase YjhB (NUDIX family)
MSERHMLSFSVAGQRYNYRVAGVAIRDGHIVVCREDDDDYVMLPGGRVEIGEASDFSLKREIAEEMAMDCAVGPMIFTSESFYGRVGERFHELSFIYELTLPETCRPGGAQPFLQREDEGHLLHFYWVKVDGPELANMRLMPPWLPEKLKSLSGVPEHVIFSEDMGA